MKKLIGIIVFSTCFLSHNVKGQEVKELTLKDALTYALQNKADAIKAKLDIENSNFQIQEVRSRALPQVTINGSLNYNPILQLNALPGDFFGAPGTTILAPLGQKWNSIGGVTLTQVLFDQSVFTGLKAAKTTREFYQINSDLTDEQLIERVANAYYQIYVQQLRLEIVENNLQNATKIRDVILGQYNNGLARKIDLDRINVRVNNINSTRQQLINAISIQENALKFYMGMPFENKIVIAKTAFEFKPEDLSTSLDINNKTEYMLLKKQEELLLYQKKSFQASYYPVLSLTGSFNYFGQGPEMPLFAKPSDGVFWSDFSTIGLNLRIPVFTGFSTKSKVKQADNAIKKLQADIEDTKIALDFAFENSKKQIENSLITISNQKENVKLAQSVLDNTNNNYLQGLATLTDLLDAESALVEAQNNYNNAILEYKLAEIQFLKSKGELKSLKN